MENYRPFENQILILFDANIRLVTDFQSKAKIFNCLYIRDIEVNHCEKVNYGVPVQGIKIGYHTPTIMTHFGLKLLLEYYRGSPLSTNSLSTIPGIQGV